MSGFIERGGVWVGVQFAWFAAIVLVGRFDLLTLSFPGRRGVSWLLIGAAVILGVAASWSLGRNLTPYPKPVAAGTMIEHGPYRLVRHPIYTAVIIGMIGIAVRGGDWLGLIMAVALVPFFYAKSTFEERHLVAQYPGYADYQQRVPYRLVPAVL